MKATSKTQCVRHLSLTLAAAALFVTCTSAFGAEAPAQTEQQKTLYAIGVSMARSLAIFELTPTEFEFVKQGLIDAQTGKKGDLDITPYSSKIQELAKSRRKASGERQLGAGKEFLAKAAAEKGAIKTESGMVYKAIVEGKGASPKASDVVKVNYRGTLTDGKEFDSSYKHGRPLEFKLENVIKCWVEGVQMMKTGGKAKLVCPPELAYGDNGAGEMILPGSTLAFEVELLEVNPAKPVAAPAAPAAPVKK
jgi:FKBP-type peptidyl-prolyl cis-trans isomerase FkpA